MQAQATLLKLAYFTLTYLHIAYAVSSLALASVIDPT